MKQTLLLFLSAIFFQAANAQEVLKGVIRDGRGLPIEGATVKIKNTSFITLANAKGEFILKTSKSVPFTLEITSAGFSSADVDVKEIKESGLNIVLLESNQLNELVITSRRRIETAQDVPIPISVIGGKKVDEAGAFNVNRLKELVPSVQLYASNPRNTTLNIRGQGSTFGLTNDGIDPGVGFYVDGVYYARPAATALDFVDVDQIEVLRGPQGTLFGKNTTAGAFNITTRAPKFSPGATFELSYGNFGFLQAKTSVTGALGKKLAARVSFSGTQRNGLLTNVATNQPVNDLNNIGARVQLLYKASEKTKITLIGDITDQKPNGYAQVFAGAVKTNRPGYRQFDSIIKDLNYQLPSRNPFDRLIDHNTTWKSGNQLGGVSVNLDSKIGNGTLTSTTAWRYWLWDPSNDRDFTGLPVLTKSQATSKHKQWTQEIRYAGNFSSRLSGVIGAFFISQDLNTDPFHIEESGSAQARFSLNTNKADTVLWKTPGLFEGYGIKTNSRLQSTGAAVFGQVDWAVTDKLHVLPGVRYNYDKKKVDFNRQTYGGLNTAGLPNQKQLDSIKRIVYSNQAFSTEVEESNFSGQLTVSYKPAKNINTFATYSVSYKPVGVNLGGLPTDKGRVMTELGAIKPEFVSHYELGAKTNPTKNSTLNVVIHNTDIKDYQTQVQSPELGAGRGYLANAEKVRVWGVEVDGNVQLNKHFSVYANLAYTDGKYVKFTNAPLPLEETGKTIPDPADPNKKIAINYKDISGGVLPGISKWITSFGGEAVTNNNLSLFGQEGEYFIATDLYYRSGFSSSPSPSKFLNIDAYYLVNGRLGFRSKNGLSIFAWSRNLLNRNYFEQLLPAAGNAGHFAGVLGDPATYGITLRYKL